MLRSPRRVLDVTAGAWLLAVLWICLHPTADQPARVVETCVLCGPEGTTNLVLNVLLYLPVGVWLRATTGSTLAAGLGGLLLCTSIETAQWFIPGRFVSLVDVVANTTGALLGAWIVTRAARLAPPSRTGAILATVFATAVLVGSTVALTPRIAPGGLFAGWTPDLGRLAGYPGRMLAARIGLDPAFQGPLPGRRPTEAFWRGEVPVLLAFVVAEPPDDLSPLFQITAGADGETLLLAVLGDDLVVRTRHLANDLELGTPDVVFDRALAAHEAGDTVSLSLSRGVARGYSLAVDGAPAGSRAYSVARGWGLLRFPLGMAPLVRSALDLTWIFFLFLPIGLWSIGAGCALGLGAMPLATMALSGLHPFLSGPAVPSYLAALAALAVGAAVRVRFGSWMAALGDSSGW